MMLHHLPYVMVLLTTIWIIAFICEFKLKRLTIADHLYLMACALLALFVGLVWISLERPPMRTLGETRLLYSLFLAWIGFFVLKRLKIRWLNTYAIVMSLLFLLINILHPELYDQTLMPALQSLWFVPHVVVYMVGYAFLGASCLAGIKGVMTYEKTKDSLKLREEKIIGIRLAVLGLIFVTYGLIFGALWAKEAWGHYWTWDPKETWALITWLIYLLILHLELNRKIHPLKTFWFLILAFVMLLICWFGVNYLPTAALSVHTYS